MRPPPMTGDDQPPPGIVCFQATFLVLLHSVGRPPFSTWPCPVGPRNSGQASAARGLGASAIDTAQASKQHFMMLDLGIPPGFAVDAGDFAELVAAKKVNKFSVTGRQVTLYLGD